MQPIVISAAESDPPLTVEMATGVVVADVNKDGAPDILIATKGAANLLILGDAESDVTFVYDATTMTAAVDTQTVIGAPSDDAYETRSIAVGDVDFDGNVDIVVGNAFAPNFVYFGDGSGVFSGATQLGVDTDAECAASRA